MSRLGRIVQVLIDTRFNPEFTDEPNDIPVARLASKKLLQEIFCVTSVPQWFIMKGQSSGLLRPNDR